MSPPTSVIAHVSFQRMICQWFVVMTDHYVSGLLIFIGIILFLLQRLGVIEVGTQAITASHNAMIQFTQQQMVYVYISMHNDHYMDNASYIPF